MEQKVIVIVGPTCSGKTSLSLKIADKINSEIISADSRQIFKYLDIGTAKPSQDELKKVRHHFIDILDPNVNYNVSKFEEDSLLLINLLIKKNKVPIVVGGSGLYIRALIDGLFSSVDADEDFRSNLNKKRELYGNEFLYEELKKVDPVSASKMLPQNWKRVVRALEVYHLSGKSISDLQEEHEREQQYDFRLHGLMWERQILYKNIEDRVDFMIEKGLVEEVKNLLNSGFDKSLNSLNTVGYKEIISYLENEYSLERAIELIKRNTRRFAKRQLTWFRADKRIVWHDVKSQKDFDKIANQIIRREELHERND